MGLAPDGHVAREAGLAPASSLAPDGRVAPGGGLTPDGSLAPDGRVAPDGSVAPDGATGGGRGRDRTAAPVEIAGGATTGGDGRMWRVGVPGVARARAGASPPSATAT